MMLRLVKLIRKRWRRWTIALLALFLALNGVAFMHAWRMTHFVTGGIRPDLKTASIFGKLGAVFTGIAIPRPANTITPADLQLPYSTHRFATSDGLNIEAWFIAAPGAQTSRGLVILFHGYTNAKSSVLGEAKEFRELGYDTLLVDFRGAGGSDGNASTIGFLEANDVRAAVNFAKAKLAPKQTILYGQSLGALAILRAIATSDVQPDAIVLECPYDRLITTVSHRFHMMNLPAFGLAHLLVFWGGVQNGYWGFAHNGIDYAPSVHCRALVMSGKNDPWVLPEEAQAVTKQMRGETTYATIPGVSHEGAYPKNPEGWRLEVHSFLQNFEAKQSPADGR